MTEIFAVKWNGMDCSSFMTQSSHMVGLDTCEKGLYAVVLTLEHIALNVQCLNSVCILKSQEFK